MSDQSDLPFANHVAAYKKWLLKEKLQEHLLKLWRTNTAFRRVVEMDKIMLVNRGESFYCTRLVDREGETEYDVHMGPLKGYASPGCYVKFTQHHTVCYPGWQNVYSGLTKAGHHLSYEQWQTLRQTGLIYTTNGLDNRLHWAMPVDRKIRKLLNQLGYRTCDVLHGEERAVAAGDYLCVSDAEEKVVDKGMESRKLVISVGRIRSKAYGKERFRSLHDLH